VANTLSRRLEEEEERVVEIKVLSRPYWRDIELVEEENQKDPILKKIMEELKNNHEAHRNYTLESGRLHYKGWLVLSASSSWTPRLLHEYHTMPLGGHSEIFHTYKRIGQSLHWNGLKKVVTGYVHACTVCQQNKYQASPPQGVVKPLPISNTVWEELSVDFIIRLLKSCGKDTILVVVDRLCKYGHFIAFKHPYSARMIAEVFVKEIVRLHGIPMSIVSDRDSTFLSLFWKELFKLQGTMLKMRMTYHPETDGQTEVLNRTLETYLRCFSSKQPKMWANFLP